MTKLLIDRAIVENLIEACEQRLPLAGEKVIIDELDALRTALAEQPGEPTHSQRVLDGLRQLNALIDEDDEAVNKWLSDQDANELSELDPSPVTKVAEGLGDSEAAATLHYGKQDYKRPMTLRECMEAEEPAPSAEPVAWIDADLNLRMGKSRVPGPLYAAPPAAAARIAELEKLYDDSQRGLISAHRRIKELEQIK